MANTGVPVIITSNGTPVRRVYKNAPLLTAVKNGKGTPITLTPLGAPFIIDGIDPPTPSTPLDVINSQLGGFTNYTRPFNLDTDCMVFYLACEFRGDPVISITHGGEPLTIVSQERTVPSPVSGRQSLCLIAEARGLTVEEANLVISATGGELDGGGFRIRSLPNIGIPPVRWTEQDNDAAKPVRPIVVRESSGGTIKGAFVNMTADRAHGDHITNAEEVMNSATISGEAITNYDTTTAGPWVLGTGWSRVGSTLVHAGASETAIRITPPAQPNALRALTFRAIVGPNSYVIGDTVDTRIGEGVWESFGMYNSTSGPMTLRAYGDVVIERTQGYYSARSLAWIFFSSPSVIDKEMDISMIWESPWAWAVAEIMETESDWTPAELFLLGQAGHWAGGYAPEPFTPALLFPTGGAGHWSGGYAPEPFTPEFLFSPTTAGYWQGKIEEST